MTYWTDEELVKQETICRNSAAAEFVDLYRLARLGLAAEQVGRDNLASVIDNEEVDTWTTAVGREKAAALDAFLNHPAWEAP